jgi:hypothetical protein
VVKSRQSVDWSAYFKSIRSECPWSYAAYNKGQIDIVEYTGQTIALGDFAARVYKVNDSDVDVESLSEHLDKQDAEYEWLFSYPAYGDYATPVPVLIQQWRHQLEAIRNHLKG